MNIIAYVFNVQLNKIHTEKIIIYRAYKNLCFGWMSPKFFVQPQV